MNRSMALAIVCAVLVMLAGGAAVWWHVSQQAALDSEPLPRAIDAAERRQWETRAWDLGRRIEYRINGVDPGALIEHMDVDLLAARATRGVSLPASKRRAVMAGLKEGLTEMGGSFATEIGEGGSYTLLRLRWKDGRPWLMFRMIGQDGALTYHEYEVDADRPVAVARDILVYATGELFSETLRRIHIDFRMGDDPELTRAMETFEQTMRLLRQQKHLDAFTLFQTLPASIRRHKICILAKISICSGLGEAEHLAALEEAEIAFAGQEWANLALLDCYVLRKEWDKANECIDRLSRAVGGDVYLDVLRAANLALQGHFDESVPMAVQAAETDVTCILGLWQQTGLALEAKRFDVVARVLTIVEKQFHIELADLTEVEGYEEFVKSADYRQWLKSRAASQPGP